MRRLSQFDYLSEGAVSATEIPNNAIVENITDLFSQKGPIVIGYYIEASTEEKENNLKALKQVTEDAFLKLEQ